MSDLQRIHLIFKTHLDVGFTDLAENVVRRYFECFIPRAIDLAAELRADGGSDRFIWTTGSWLIYEYLEQASPPQRARLENAILAGDIAWHALPFTTHSELMDPALFRFGLSLSAELDRRFGKQTIAAKLTDVPGHTLGIVPLLAQAGVTFLHVGVNPASTPPDFPTVCRWRAPQGEEVVLMVNRGSYGDLTLVPGSPDAICFAHSGDNLGPPSAADVRKAFADTRRRFPGVKVHASTLDAFAAGLPAIRDGLPLVTQEAGDTWIHGAASDPLKLSRYRELLRLLAEWRADGRLAEGDPGYRACCRRLILVPEHTWGLDEKTHLGSSPVFNGEAFQAARQEPRFERFAASWAEQRRYVDQALAALPEESLRAEAGRRLAGLRPTRAVREAYPVSQNPAGVFPCGGFDLTFDPGNGSLVGLVQRATGRLWSGPQNPLGLFAYETFSRADYDRFYADYVIQKEEVAEWAIRDFTKPDMPGWAEHRSVFPRLRSLLGRKDGDGCLLILENEGEPVERYGCPREVWVEYRPGDRSNNLEVRLQWFGKTATRLPEASWFAFAPRLEHPENWRMEKLGLWIDPLEILPHGNRGLHAVGDGGVRWQAAGEGLSIRSLDAALVAPGEGALLRFDDHPPRLEKGMRFLLHDNLWGTNFPMWYGEDASFRFRLEFNS